MTETKIKKLQTAKKPEKKAKKKDEVKVPILTKIQNELHAPRSNYNQYGDFNYRNAEEIEQALKPLLAKYGAQLSFDEKIDFIGNRFYVTDTAHYKDSEQEVTATGHAREADKKKGMDASQLTGSCSSYATKYALAKLFLIDDTRDADSMDNRGNTNQPVQKKYVKKTSRATPNYKQFTDSELDSFTVMYHPEGTKPTDAKQTPIRTIYQYAMNGDKDAAKWWHENRKRVHSTEGQALLQYEMYEKRLRARSAALKKRASN